MAKTKENYQTLQAELVAIMEWFESDSVDVDEATKQYERGMEIVAKLESYLKNAEVTIEKIKTEFSKKA
jgi:exodeoxyribonuclease VII small subunit